jgi:hypothetical protein
MQLDVPTETESDRDGLLSYSAEWHALAHGVYGGLCDFRDWDGLRPAARKNPDVVKEIAYAKAGYVLGCLLRVAVYVAIAVMAT